MQYPHPELEDVAKVIQRLKRHLEEESNDKNTSYTPSELTQIRIRLDYLESTLELKAPVYPPRSLSHLLYIINLTKPHE